MSNLIEIPLRGTKQLEAFRLRHTAFVDIYLEPLSQIRNGIASTPYAMDRDERVLYALGRLVFEDFIEVVVNCANGLTTGAMKIQRGMYERAVTLVYLDQNPTQIEKFFNYFYIADWKKIQEARLILPDLFPDEFYEQKRREYEAARDAYLVPVCRECNSARKKAEKDLKQNKVGCNHQRVNHTWSTLDVVSMSEKLEGFKELRLLAYYTNMEETHSTVHAVLRRFSHDNETGFSYSEGHLPESEGLVLLLAHHLVMFAVQVLRNRFGDGQADNQLWKLCEKHLHEHATSVWDTNNSNEDENM